MFVYCGLYLIFAGIASASSQCDTLRQTSDTVDVVINDAGADAEQLSLVQLRAQRKQRNAMRETVFRFIPDAQVTYQLEAYLVAFKSYNLEKCGNMDGPKQYVRWGGIGNISTDCLTEKKMNDWTSDTGFNNCYSVEVGPNPELDISFEAYHNEAGDICSHDLQDTCHIHEAFTLSTSEIEDINVWLNGKLGAHDHGHELYYVYRLLELTTTTTTTPQPAVCRVFGDPHITGFDNAEVSLLKLALLNGPHNGNINVFESGDFWLVKSDLMNIQGRFHTHHDKKRSYLRVLAVGGPFIQNNTLIIGGYGPDGAKVFWNDEEILQTVGSVYSNYLISAFYREDVQLVQDSDRTAKEGFEISLPLEVHLLINRGKNGLGLMITMPKLDGSQDGECGNYNGDSSDDTAEMIATRLGSSIPGPEKLFHHDDSPGGDIAGAASQKHSRFECFMSPMSCLR